MRKRKTEGEIAQYDPVIYPRKLWVIKASSNDTIKVNFLCRDGQELDLEEHQPGNEPVMSVLTKVMLERDGKYGSLVVLWGDNEPTIKHVAHESGHIAMSMLTELGILIDPDNQEPVTYLIGWVAEAIDDAIRSWRTDKAGR